MELAFWKAIIKYGHVDLKKKYLLQDT